VALVIVAPSRGEDNGKPATKDEYPDR
jgi:hypothetical protein